MPNSEKNVKPVQTAFQNCEPTICVNCIFHYNKEPGSPRADGWYNQICKAVAREPGIDFVTGQEGYVGRNDLGNTYITEDEFEYCRNINTRGNCEYYKAKSSASQPKYG